MDSVIDACDRLSRELTGPLSGFLSRPHLQARIARELGSHDPFQFCLRDHRQDVYERCCPLGLVVHVTPDPEQGICAVVDGLLTGNRNILVVEREDHPVARFVHSLLACDRTLPVSVVTTDCLTTALAQAHAVNAWGEIAQTHELTPANARFQAFSPPNRIVYFSGSPPTSDRTDVLYIEDLNSTQLRGAQVALCCPREQLAHLSEALVRAGAANIVTLEALGEFRWTGALSDYVRRVTCEAGPDTVSTLPELKPWSQLPPSVPLMTKEDFQSREVTPESADLFFRSGGSSGQPKLSVFTYRDFQVHHRAQAAGLFAAGLDPRRDRCMNLFVAGGLYGGFVSFYTVLETLNAVHFPMAAYADTQLVAETIVAQRCNVLLGMPTYLLPLFHDHSELLRGKVEKIFYGGEPLHENQRSYFENEFGVKIVRSSGYGSVDAGPIGYQCVDCAGAVYHLHCRLHTLELVDLEQDRAVAPGQPGRVVLTSLVRAGQPLDRYDVGDVAREVAGPCPCGRVGPRLELLGRHGDVFRVGGGQFNYRKFVKLVGGSGEVQLILSSSGVREEMLVRVSRSAGAEPLRDLVLEGYPELREMVVRQGRLDLRVEAVDAEKLERSPSSGKLLRVLDLREDGPRLDFRGH